MRVDLDHEFAVARLALSILGFAFFLWSVRAQRHPEGRPIRALRLALLGLLGAVAVGSYYYFYQYGRLKITDTFHYYVGSKYFPELGYYGLYDCALAALAGQGLADPQALRHVRNLATMRLESPRAALERGLRCPSAFSPARWSAFTADVAWFHARTPKPRWQHVMEDHGYHPSPVWTLFGRPLASSVPLSRAGTRLLARLDHGLVLGAWLVMGLTVGFEAACFAAILWGTGFLWRYSWIGDAFLRQLWFASSIAGLCLLYRRRHASAGVLLTTAALLRVFPGVLLLGWAAHALRGSWRTRALSPGVRRFAVASALGGAALVAASVPVSGRGIAVYPEFVHKITRFAERPAVNKMGLGVVTRALEERLSPGGTRAAPLAAVRVGVRTLRLLVVVLGLLAFWSALTHALEAEAAALGLTLLPLLSEPANYYYSFVVAALLLALRRPRIGVLLFLACIAWSTNGLVFYQQDVEFLGASLVALALSFAILREMARPPDAALA